MDERAYAERARNALMVGQTAAIDSLFDQEHDELERTFAEKHQQLLATTTVLKETLTELYGRGWNTHAQLWNVCLHINLAAHDLSVMVWQLFAERDIWARKLAARHVALLVFEITEDFTQLLGGPFREALHMLGTLKRFEPDLRSARKPLDSFRQVRSSELNRVRNIAAAHRDHDGLRLLNTIESIDIEQIM